MPSDVVGELVMEALSTLDQVAYIRFASVYRNFREAKGFWRVPRADHGGWQLREVMSGAASYSRSAKLLRGTDRCPHETQISAWPGGSFDHGSYSVELGSKRNAVGLREDRRLDRRCLRQATKLRIPRSGAGNDRSAVQEAPEPTRFRTTANLG